MIYGKRKIESKTDKETDKWNLHFVRQWGQKGERKSICKQGTKENFIEIKAER